MEDLHEERFVSETDTELQFLIKHMEKVAGAWDGKDSGLAEDRAHAALDIIEKAKELRALVDDFISL